MQANMWINGKVKDRLKYIDGQTRKGYIDKWMDRL